MYLPPLVRIFNTQDLQFLQAFSTVASEICHVPFRISRARDSRFVTLPHFVLVANSFQMQQFWAPFRSKGLFVEKDNSISFCNRHGAINPGFFFGYRSEQAPFICLDEKSSSSYCKMRWMVLRDGPSFLLRIRKI